MKIRMLKSEKGIILVIVMVFTLILTILGVSLLSISDSEIVLTRININKIRAFYLAEAGVQLLNTRLRHGIFTNVEDTPLGGGSYRVDYYSDENPPYAIATGTAGNQEKKIKVVASFLAPPYEYGVYAGGAGGEVWTLMLRGTGSPVTVGNKESGGQDIINGNLFVRGNVAMYEDSSVHPPIGLNPYGLEGDVEATGNINLYNNATVSGSINQNASLQDPPNLVGMNYAVNNTHNVSQIFAGQTIGTNGHLPAGHPLRDVFAKNPTDDRADICASTAGVDDYFLEPSTGFTGGNWKTAPTPLHVGKDRIYYIDGNLWVNSVSDTFGMNVDGKATIVVTGDIYICDNLTYADSNSLLGLVALGKYNSSGQRTSGGNIIFGDPTFGTMYTASAMMFAANNFLFNSKTLGTYPTEPESGFTINGNISALNQVSIERDWYTKAGTPSTRRPARYNSATSQWVDSVTGTVLTITQKGTLKHYQMILNYDDRVRTWLTQPPGLPRGVGTIYNGLMGWEEVQCSE